MKKMTQTQARAVVGGGFFKSLFKISTGGLLGDPGVAVAVASGAVTKASAKLAQR